MATNATRKKTNVPQTTEDSPTTVLKEATCNSLEGSAKLTYQIGTDDSGEILFRISANTGGGSDKLTS